MGKLRGAWLPVLLGLFFLGLGTVGGLLAARLQGSRDVVARFVLPVEPPVDFQLRDQNGRVTSPRDALGKVLVMTFLFTNCDDVCPAQAQIIGEAARKAGKGVEVYAVSVDPAADTPVRASSCGRCGRATGSCRLRPAPPRRRRPRAWASTGSPASRARAGITSTA